MKLVQLKDCGKCSWNNIPTDPPVESWQNSNRPSNTGQSSPTLTVSKRMRQKDWIHPLTVRILHRSVEEKRTLTSLHLFAILRHVVWSDGPQELNVVITVVFCHLFTTGFVWSLEKNKDNEGESDSWHITVVMQSTGLSLRSLYLLTCLQGYILTTNFFKCPSY